MNRGKSSFLVLFALLSTFSVIIEVSLYLLIKLFLRMYGVSLK